MLGLSENTVVILPFFLGGGGVEGVGVSFSCG